MLATIGIGLIAVWAILISSSSPSARLLIGDHAVPRRVKVALVLPLA